MSFWTWVWAAARLSQAFLLLLFLLLLLLVDWAAAVSFRGLAALAFVDAVLLLLAAVVAVVFEVLVPGPEAGCPLAPPFLSPWRCSISARVARSGSLPLGGSAPAAPA